MQRRTFLTASLLTLAAPSLVVAGSGKMVEFTKADPIQTALDQGKTVLVDFSAKWCSTCARQARVINELRAGNPKYDANVVFVNVDWDQFKNAPVVTSRNIPRRSTLIVLKGKQELGRIVAGTGKSEIKALMDTALAAATNA